MASRNVRRSYTSASVGSSAAFEQHRLGVHHPPVCGCVLPKFNAFIRISHAEVVHLFVREETRIPTHRHSRRPSPWPSRGCRVSANGSDSGCAAALRGRLQLRTVDLLLPAFHHALQSKERAPLTNTTRPSRCSEASLCRALRCQQNSGVFAGSRSMGRDRTNGEDAATLACFSMRPTRSVRTLRCFTAFEDVREYDHRFRSALMRTRCSNATPRATSLLYASLMKVSCTPSSICNHGHGCQVKRRSAMHSGAWPGAKAGDAMQRVLRRLHRRRAGCTGVHPVVH